MQPPLSPAVFTPDGLGIVFSIARDQTCFLYRADISTGVASRVTKSVSGCEFDPVFSPDGRHLAFARAPEDGLHASIVLSDSDGSGERVLVPGDDDNLQPTFVPHSNRVLFMRSAAFEHHSPFVNNNRHKFDVFVVDGIGGGVSALTHEQFYEISRVSVSADSEKILLSVSTYPQGDHFLVAPMGSPATFTRSFQPAIQNAPVHPVCRDAVWLPDGRSLLFLGASETPGSSRFDYNIYRLTIDAGSVDRLTDLIGVVDGFSVSPDAKRAVLLQRGVYSVLDLDTRQLAPIELRLP